VTETSISWKAAAAFLLMISTGAAAQEEQPAAPASSIRAVDIHPSVVTDGSFDQEQVEHRQVRNLNQSIATQLAAKRDRAAAEQQGYAEALAKAKADQTRYDRDMERYRAELEAWRRAAAAAGYPAEEPRN